MIEQWQDEGGPFGNAGGLDYVASDVYCRLAHRFGATITVGHLPADIAAEQPGRLEAERAHYGDRFTDHTSDPDFALFTISHDGLTLSGEHPDGNGYTRGYRSHYWLDRIGPRTLVVDLRTVPEDRIVEFAVRGPMVKVTLEDGTLSTLREAVASNG